MNILRERFGTENNEQKEVAYIVLYPETSSNKYPWKNIVAFHCWS